MSMPHVCTGATLQCSFGVAPATLNVLPVNRVLLGGLPAATLMDHIPILNITPFAMCQSMANPTVAAATAAKLGVFTPMPCVPVTAAPWIPGGATTVMVGNMPALNAGGTLMCNWGGVIKVVSPGQATVMLP
ncbi:DUF4280 domain-containing protein [Jeongeupia chitinilytica]|uniref:DUF4280 domain-containing protein n=1 Tax=Jeongeupia chitinilytica TaxID=1041641 RepID=A0ABQ3GYC9_9NEIS|nr:DUF4280 domain-containing protein [Jeongeupia chitinilytica]GHD56160.1 hypothetical protein GCM10007350_02710 [Jeongeupia chitinilytica]